MAATKTSTKDKTRGERRRATGNRIGAVDRKDPSKDRSETRGRGSKSPSRHDVKQEVAQELLKLRSLLKEVGTNCLDRLDGELAGLALSLAGENLLGDPPILPSTPILLRMLADIKAFKVKPKKRQVKDLRRIEVLLDSLNSHMPPEE